MHRNGGSCAAVLGVTLALSAIGCGSTSRPLTRAELISRADVVCSRLQHQSDAMLRTATASLSRDRSSRERLIRELYPKVAVNQQTALKDLEALTPPDSLRGPFTGYVDAMRTTIATQPSAADAIAGRNPHQTQRHAAVLRAGTFASQLGFRSCH